MFKILFSFRRPFIMHGDRCCTTQTICASYCFLQMQKEADKIEPKYSAKFPHLISSNLISSHLLYTFSYIAQHCSSLLLFFSPPCLFSFSCHFFLPESAGHQSGPHLSVWCLGPSPFFSGPPASWLQPLIRPSSFAPSACCQNSPHQSGTPAPWKPVPIRLSSGTLYPFCFLSLFIWADLFPESFSLSSFCYMPTILLASLFIFLFLIFIHPLRLWSWINI